MKSNTFYFSHDSNAQDDPKCLLLIDQMGMEGYGIFWALIEKLRQEDTFSLPISVASSYARRWNTSTEKIKTVILNYNLFVIENDMFFSIRLKNSMEVMRSKASLAARKRWELNAPAMLTDANAMQAHANALQTHTDRNATAMLKHANKSKVNKSKVKESGYRQFDKSNYTQQQLESFEKFNQWIDEKIPYLRSIEKQITIDEFLKLKANIDASEEYASKLFLKLTALSNKPNASKIYKSVYLTILNWMSND